MTIWVCHRVNLILLLVVNLNTLRSLDRSITPFCLCWVSDRSNYHCTLSITSYNKVGCSRVAQLKITNIKAKTVVQIQKINNIKLNLHVTTASFRYYRILDSISADCQHFLIISFNPSWTAPFCIEKHVAVVIIVMQCALYCSHTLSLPFYAYVFPCSEALSEFSFFSIISKKAQHPYCRHHRRHYRRRREHHRHHYYHQRNPHHG